MRARSILTRSVKILGSWAAVTCLFAACSAAFTELPGDIIDAGADLLPWRDVHADTDSGTVCDCPAPPERKTYDVVCDQIIMIDGANHATAKHDFAGKTRKDLVDDVRVFAHSTNGVADDAGVGYTTDAPMLVEDGHVTVDCGQIPGSIRFDKVTFITSY